MDANAVTSLIMNIGFPIVMCLLMGWYIYDSGKTHREQIESMNKAHANEVDNLTERYAENMKMVTEAIQNNTTALRELSERIGGSRNEGN